MSEDVSLFHVDWKDYWVIHYNSIKKLAVKSFIDKHTLYYALSKNHFKVSWSLNVQYISRSLFLERLSQIDHKINKIRVWKKTFHNSIQKLMLDIAHIIDTLIWLDIHLQIQFWGFKGKTTLSYITLQIYTRIYSQNR